MTERLADIRLRLETRLGCLWFAKRTTDDWGSPSGNPRHPATGRAALAILWLCGLTVGCGQAKFGQVSGHVTLDGKPLPQVAVRFEDEGGSATIARTDQAGNYVLRYTVHQPGAPVGKHKVTIFTPAPETEGTGERAKAELVPARYNTKSTLTEEVKPGSQTINFALTSKP